MQEAIKTNKGNGKDTPGMGEMTEEGKLRQKEAEKNKINTIIAIGKDPKGKVYVFAPLSDKKFCFKLLGEAVKIIADSEEPIIKPAKGFLNGIRNLRRH